VQKIEPSPLRGEGKERAVVEISGSKTDARM
jgi:hypothetical protein